MESKIRQEKELVLAQILYLYIIPTLLLYYGIIPPHFRIVLLFVVSLLMYGIIKRAKWTYNDLAIKKDFMKDVVPYAIFTVVGVCVLLWLSSVVPFLEGNYKHGWWKDIRFLLLFIPISVLQEIIFRGILMRLLRRAFSDRFFIFTLNASLFALIHIIYDNSLFILPLTFFGGLGFAWIYYRYPNLILVSISHTILNFIAMILGFFVVK